MTIVPPSSNTWMINLASNISWTWIILALLTFVFLVSRERKKLPPGPRGFPIFGSMHLLGKSPHRNLQKLAEKYGPIMHLKLGMVHAIVVSSSQAAELFLKTHDLNFASRPPLEIPKRMSYNNKSMIFGTYGPYWRDMRKMCTLELLSSNKINSFKSIRQQELDLLIEFIMEAARDCVPVDLSAKIMSLGADMSCRMIFGKKYWDKEFDEIGFKAVFAETLQLLAAPNLGDYIPGIAALDLQGLKKLTKANIKVFDGFIDRIIDEHIQLKDGDRTKDFVDVMLDIMGSEESEYQIGRDNIKAVITEMVGASMETSATTIEWSLSELIKQPQIIKKLQNELQEKIGLERKVEESDLDNLEYLNMVIKETFRLHPVVPLLVPHLSIEDSNVNGFHIPKNSHVIINAWAIGREPCVWAEPERFNPERFGGSDIDVLGHHFQLIPFGSGRRICPGLMLGLTVVRLVLAQLVHCFDWELPDGMLPFELDMTEGFGLVTPRVKHLKVVPTYRLCV